MTASQGVEVIVRLSACLTPSQRVEAFVANHSKIIFASSILCGRKNHRSTIRIFKNHIATIENIDMTKVGTKLGRKPNNY